MQSRNDKAIQSRDYCTEQETRRAAVASAVVAVITAITIRIILSRDYLIEEAKCGAAAAKTAAIRANFIFNPAVDIKSRINSRLD